MVSQIICYEAKINKCYDFSYYVCHDIPTCVYYDKLNMRSCISMLSTFNCFYAAFTYTITKIKCYFSLDLYSCMADLSGSSSTVVMVCIISFPSIFSAAILKKILLV